MLKKFDPTMQPFESTENEKGPEDQKSEEGTTEQQRLTSKTLSSTKEKQINNQQIATPQKKISASRKKDNPYSVERKNKHEV